MTAPNLKVITAEQLDRRMGRHVHHDERSRNFAAPPPKRAVERRDRSHLIYDPQPNPNQSIGNCTCCAEMMLANARGNRVRRQVLKMDDADKAYRIATRIDPFPGQWEPNDTGSDGLSAAKASVQLGIGERYEWYFGLDATLDGLQLHPLSVGTWWMFDMFHPDKNGRIRPTGGKAGGHQYVLRSHDVSASRLTIGNQRVGLRCWWGSYRDVWMTVDDFAELLSDDGDVHFTVRAGRNA